MEKYTECFSSRTIKPDSPIASFPVPPTKIETPIPILEPDNPGFYHGLAESG
jgi:hypothetical protein